MPTINQLIKGIRKKKISKVRKQNALMSCPQKKGVCLKVFIMNPKKPNSANRKVARVRLSTQKDVTVYIPGQGHNLQKFSVVLIRGGRVQDLPGVHYKIIRGKYDCMSFERFERKSGRSKYGVSCLKFKKSFEKKFR